MHKVVRSDDVMNALRILFASLRGKRLPVSEVGMAVYLALKSVPEFDAPPLNDLDLETLNVEHESSGLLIPESGSSDVQVASREAAEKVRERFDLAIARVPIDEIAAIIATALRSREQAVRDAVWKDAIQIAKDYESMNCVVFEKKYEITDSEYLSEVLKAKAQSFRKEGE